MACLLRHYPAPGRNLVDRRIAPPPANSFPGRVLSLCRVRFRRGNLHSSWRIIPAIAERSMAEPTGETRAQIFSLLSPNSGQIKNSMQIGRRDTLNEAFRTERV